MFEISGATPATKEVLSNLVYLKAWNAYPSCCLTEDLTVASSTTMDSMVLREKGLVLLWDNLVWMLRADFLSLFIYFLEAMGLIYLMFVLAAMFNFLKVFEMVSSPYMTLKSSSLLGILTCLRVTESSLVLKLY